MGLRGGPAPNAYLLPTTLGHAEHDATKVRAPAYTMGVKHAPEQDHLGPGLYDINAQTRYGVPKPPAFTMANRLNDLNVQPRPAPNAYCPKFEVAKVPRAPAFTIGTRACPPMPYQSPSPNLYSLPPAMGPKVPDKPTVAAFTMYQKAKDPTCKGIPGPDHYGSTPMSAYKQSIPKYTMGRRVWIPADRTVKPAPNAYSLDTQAKKGITFGIRHSDRANTYITADDIRFS